MNTVTLPLETFMKAKNPNAPVIATATIGKPLLVQYAQILGAWPRNARPYSTREDEKRKELPAEKADVKMHALMMWGRTLIPERVIAMT